MTCRRLHPLAPAAAAAALGLVLGLSPVAAPAGNISALENPTTDLVFSSAAGITPTPPANGTPQVIIALPYKAITPSGTASEPGSPLSIDLAAYNGQAPGFDSGKLLVGLKEIAPTAATATAPATPGQDLLGLSFLGSGLAPGGQLIFKLNKGSGWAADTALSLVSSPNAAGDVARVLPPPTTTTVGTTVPAATTPAAKSTSSDAAASSAATTVVPEPVSVALWSAVAAAGLLRARVARRRKA